MLDDHITSSSTQLLNCAAQRSHHRRRLLVNLGRTWSDDARPVPARPLRSWFRELGFHGSAKFADPRVNGVPLRYLAAGELLDRCVQAALRQPGLSARERDVAACAQAA